MHVDMPAKCVCPPAAGQVVINSLFQSWRKEDFGSVYLVLIGANPLDLISSEVWEVPSLMSG